MPMTQEPLPRAAPEGHTYIYGLFDPQTGKIRYIGKTKRLRHRYYGHMSAIGPNGLRQVNKHKVRWIRKLAASGHKPIMRVIDIVPDTLWRRTEQDWIRTARLMGCALVNVGPGGEGVDFLPQSQRNAIGRAHKGRKWTPERRAAASRQRKGRKLSAEARANVAAAVRRRPRLTDVQRAAMSARLTGIPKPSMRGENNHQTALLESEAVGIREACAAGEAYTAVAERFGTTKAAVADIATGKSWKYAPGPIKPVQPRAVMTPGLVVEMRELGVAGVSGRDLAGKFGIDPSTVADILTGVAWREVGGPIRAARAFHKLTAAEESAICAARRSGESAISISERLGTPIATVYNAIKRGRQLPG